MTPCPSCQTWSRPGACPGCGARVGGTPMAASAALVAFSMLATACYGTGPSGGWDSTWDSSPVDADGDGYSPYGGDSGEGVDCDDTNPAIYPGATETVGDMVDSNCDGADDT